jgi:hypothetical protein
VKIWGLLKDSTGKNLITTFSMDDNREAWMSPHVSENGIHLGNASGDIVPWKKGAANLKKAGFPYVSSLWSGA